MMHKNRYIMGLVEDKILLDKMLRDKTFAYNYIKAEFLGEVINIINKSVLKDYDYEAEDILHDFCVKILLANGDKGRVVNKLNTVNLSGTNTLTAWLYKSIKNFCIDEMNKHLVEVTKEEADEYTGEIKVVKTRVKKSDLETSFAKEPESCDEGFFALPDYTANKNTGVKVLMRVISKIENDNLRKIMSDFFLDNIPMKEIRESMEMSTAKFGTYKYRALEVFTKYLVEDGIITEADREYVLERNERSTEPVGMTLECLVGFNMFVRHEEKVVVWEDMDMNWLKSKLYELA